jgi:PAS domain S-box-containing protein
MGIAVQSATASLHRISVSELPPARPLSLGLWTTAACAAKTLLEAGAGEALVLDDGRPLGVVTTRGLSRVLSSHMDQAPHFAVRDVMEPVAVSPDTAFLPTALRHMLASPARRLAVVDARGLAVGIVAPFHVTRAVGIGDELAGCTVDQAMVRSVVTARSDEGVPLVLGRMRRAGVGGVVVVDPADRPLGMLTSRDAVARLATGEALHDLRVADLMCSPVMAVSPQLSLEVALGGMDGTGGGRLAVTDAAGQLRGVLTWTDVAAALSAALAEAEDNRHRDQASLYRELYDSAVHGLFRLDLDGCFLSANATLARLLGYDDPATLVRQARSGAPHPLRLDQPERRDLCIRALANPVPVEFETKVFRQDGSATRLRCVLRAVSDSLGAPLHLEGAAWAEPVGERDSRPGTGAGCLPGEFYCRKAPDGRLLEANEAYARYWGNTPAALVAENFQIDLPEEDRAHTQERLRRLTPLRPTTGFEHRVIRADGRLRWLRWTCRALFDAAGGLVEYRLVGRDITGRKRIEEQLRGQYLFAQTLLEAVPAPVLYRDHKGRYQGCNRAFETLMGLSREQLVGRNVQAVHPPELAQVYAEKDRELLRRGGRQVYETTLNTDAGLRHVIVRKSLFRDEDGKAAGIIAMVLDITERKRAEVAASKVRDDLEAGIARHADELREANRRLLAEAAERQRVAAELRRSSAFLETVLNAIQDGICVLGPDMTIIKVNQAMCALYGEAETLAGRQCHAVYRNLSVPCEHCPSLRALATGKLAIGVVPKMEDGAETGWMELYCYPLFREDGAVTGVVEIVRDVTARKKLEAELAAALERAEAGSQAKGAFLANMSHEIRTPLNAVLGYVQLMLRDHLEAHQRERLAVVEESATALLSIINDILDYSKIEAGRLELKAEPFDLVRCLEAVVKEQEVLARNKGLELRLKVDPDLPRTVRGDGLRLRQILRNLVNNAVKYTEKGGVTVSACVEAPGAEHPGGTDRVTVRLAVADTGQGIPKAEQATLFDSFTQVDSGLTRRQAGTGLGLAICRRLAGLMGGLVGMESQPGQGSVFWLACPFPVSRTEATPAPGLSLETGTGELPPLRILLVEDNRINRIYAADLLTSRGHEVVLAENGRAALEYLAKSDADVVLMDIQMPVMDGLTATRAIRAGQLGIDPHLPVVGLSAYAMDQERERFLAAGLDDYIIKPFGEETFFAVMRRVLARHGRPLVRKAAPAEPASAACGLDLGGLALRYRDKRELLVRVGREFLASIPRQITALDKALDTTDLAVCERVAHTLKGNAAMFGAGDMRALAAQAEAAAAVGDIAAVQGLRDPLVAACRLVTENMETFLSRLGG